MNSIYEIGTFDITSKSINTDTIMETKWITNFKSGTINEGRSGEQ